MINILYNKMTATKPLAIVLTNGLLHHSDAKTAHGLIRGTARFRIEGVLDSLHAGKDAGEVLDGGHRGIPVFRSLEEAQSALGAIEYCIIGVATHGGVLPPEFLAVIEDCIRAGISVVNGLHVGLSEHPHLVTLAYEYGAELIDIRKPKPRKQLHFWHGEIHNVDVPIIAVLGTDCAVGKRTTCRMVMEACEREGIKAQMIYTGQTGWLQGGEYGFIFDSTLNDFISGEIEHAIVSCWKETSPDVILIEGQSALRNPSGPCGSEFLVSGNAKHTILVHPPKRAIYDGAPEWAKINSLKSEIELVSMYGSAVIAVALNTEECSDDEAVAFQREYQNCLGLPVVLPLQEGVGKAIPTIKNLLFKK